MGKTNKARTPGTPPAKRRYETKGWKIGDEKLDPKLCEPWFPLGSPMFKRHIMLPLPDPGAAYGPVKVFDGEGRLVREIGVEELMRRARRDG